MINVMPNSPVLYIWIMNEETGVPNLPIRQMQFHIQLIMAVWREDWQTVHLRLIT